MTDFLLKSELWLLISNLDNRFNPRVLIAELPSTEGSKIDLFRWIGDTVGDLLSRLTENESIESSNNSIWWLLSYSLSLGSIIRFLDDGYLEVGS